MKMHIGYSPCLYVLICWYVLDFTGWDERKLVFEFGIMYMLAYFKIRNIKVMNKERRKHESVQTIIILIALWELLHHIIVPLKVQSHLLHYKIQLWTYNVPL